MYENDHRSKNPPQLDVDAVVALILLLDILELEIERLSRPQLAGVGQLLHEREELVVVAAVVEELCSGIATKRAGEPSALERASRARGELLTDRTDKLNLDTIVLDALAISHPYNCLQNREQGGANTHARQLRFRLQSSSSPSVAAYDRTSTDLSPH
jgi:hypothetical protein